jgi:HAD superfamily hydrolase (TIGR01509 family)
MPFSHIEQQLTQYLGANFPLSEFYRLSSIYWRSAVERDGIEVKAGVHDVLQVLETNAIDYCLATNSLEMSARECLQYAGIADLFPIVVSRDHVQSPKPAADIFLQAASILEQPIATCLVVEDSLIGLLAAKNANAFSVLVPSMPDMDGKMQALAGLVLNDLSELAKLVHEK